MKKTSISKRVKAGVVVAATALTAVLAVLGTSASPVLDAAWGGGGTNHNQLLGI